MYFRKFWLRGKRFTQINSALFDENEKVATICFDKTDINKLEDMIENVNNSELTLKFIECLRYLTEEGKG